MSQEDATNPADPAPPPDPAPPVEPAPPAGPVEGTTYLRLTDCPECGVVFGLPMRLWAERFKRKGGQVTCPNGHAVPVPPAAVKAGDVLMVNVYLLGELRQVRHELATTRATLARMPLPPTPAGTVDKAESERRVNLLVSRAERNVLGKPVCRLCGKSLPSPHDFKTHLKRKHADYVTTAPAALFD